ncbi:MAG: MFS transporter [Alphaproteobacteria bacterium]|jgi:MFS family permease|uniref:MFS transporter n=1 Tax=Pacificispira sp. TaxID=2888761 RepID=UPI002EA5F95C|nr:MFS transporter [Pseudomonadota bacterium]
MRQPSATLAASFSNAGHFLFHYFAAMYFTIVLAIERDWSQTYEVLMELWFPASLLIGLAALPAGRLADRWSSPGMLIVMFIGMGIATFACGFVDSSTGLMIFLAGLGLFGAIYHPVGIPWVIKTSQGKTGMRLAVNGIFGGLGAAGAAMCTGWLIELFGWRGAFAIPGVICTALGVAMLFALMTGRIAEGAKVASDRKGSAGAGGNLKAVAVMLIPMFMLGLIYNTVQNAMPKLFEERMVDLLGGEIGLVGTAVGAVYAIGAVMQLVGGYLADRYRLKTIYVGLWLLQAPLLFVLAEFGGLPLGLAAVGLAMAGTAILPTENLMLSRFAPAEHQGVIFGIKFVVSFGAAPLGLFLITETRSATGEFTQLLIAYAVAAAAVVFVTLALPRSRDYAAPVQPAAAE